MNKIAPLLMVIVLIGLAACGGKKGRTPDPAFVNLQPTDLNPTVLQGTWQTECIDRNFKYEVILQGNKLTWNYRYYSNDSDCNESSLDSVNGPFNSIVNVVVTGSDAGSIVYVDGEDKGNLSYFNFTQMTIGKKLTLSDLGKPLYKLN